MFEFKFNETNYLRRMIQKANEKNFNNNIPKSDYIIIFICLITIILSALLIFYVYKKLQRFYNREEDPNENEQIETNGDNDRIMPEIHYLNSNSFSFFPISTPIKANDIKSLTKSDYDSDKKTNDSSYEMKNTINHEKIKNDSISYFNENKSDDNIEEVIKI